MTREITKLQEIEQYILYKELRASTAAGPCPDAQPRAAVVAGTDGALTVRSDWRGRDDDRARLTGSLVSGSSICPTSP
jgi:hypothetical protein